MFCSHSSQTTGRAAEFYSSQLEVRNREILPLVGVIDHLHRFTFYVVFFLVLLRLVYLPLHRARCWNGCLTPGGHQLALHIGLSPAAGANLFLPHPMLSLATGTRPPLPGVGPPA